MEEVERKRGGRGGGGGGKEKGKGRGGKVEGEVGILEVGVACIVYSSNGGTQKVPTPVTKPPVALSGPAYAVAAGGQPAVQPALSGAVLPPLSPTVTAAPFIPPVSRLPPFPSLCAYICVYCLDASVHNMPAKL